MDIWVECDSIIESGAHITNDCWFMRWWWNIPNIVNYTIVNHPSDTWNWMQAWGLNYSNSNISEIDNRQGMLFIK